MVDPARRGRGRAAVGRGRGIAAAGRGRGRAAAGRGRGRAAAGRGRGRAAVAARARRTAYLAWLRQLENRQVAEAEQAGGSRIAVNRRIRGVRDFWDDVRRFERAITRYEQRGGFNSDLLRRHFNADPVRATELRHERDQAHAPSIVEDDNFFEQLFREDQNQRRGATCDYSIDVDDNDVLVDDNDALIDDNDVLIDDNDALIDDNDTLIDDDDDLADTVIDEEERGIMDIFDEAAEAGNQVIHGDERVIRANPQAQGWSIADLLSRGNPFVARNPFE